MALTQKHLEVLVKSPSLGAITYQSHAIIHELARIKRPKYPEQACQIRDVLWSLTDYIRDELTEMYDPGNPLGVNRDPEFQRTYALGELLRKIFSYLQHLKASVADQSPAAIQHALSSLIKVHFPNHGKKNPLCLICPQWRYNLEYMPLDGHLMNDISVGVLDPTGKFGTDDTLELLDRLWRRFQNKQQVNDARKLPQHLGILRFPALDLHDTLLFPLLAHELGHFIDFSFSPYLHTVLHRDINFSDSEIHAILEQYGETNASFEILEQQRKWLADLTAVFLRESIADLLAVRVMGIGFFISQAEFLKTLFPWPGLRVETTGYPGIGGRLSAIYDHLFSECPQDIHQFLQQNAGTIPVDNLLGYFGEWEKRLKKTASQQPTNCNEALAHLVANAVSKKRRSLLKTLKKIVPDSKCASLSDTFFERIRLLDNRRPPRLVGDSPESFAEIMSAAWAYQIIYGEEREIAKTSKRRFSEYTKTCKLVLAAI